MVCKTNATGSWCLHCLCKKGFLRTSRKCWHVNGICVLQDKLQRTQVTECIVLCTESYLRRDSQQGSQSGADRWLAKVTKPVIANLRKGNFQFQEQQVRRWSCVLSVMQLTCPGLHITLLGIHAGKSCRPD